MSLSLARLDLTQIFCDVDDFYREFERLCDRDMARLPCDGQPKRYQSRLSISEVMTIVIACFNMAGDRVVTTSSDDTARLWDLQGRQLAIYEGYPAALSSDGQRVATVVDDRVKVYDIDTLPELIDWGCQRLHNYLEYGQATDADRAICTFHPATQTPLAPSSHLSVALLGWCKLPDPSGVDGMG